MDRSVVTTRFVHLQLRTNDVDEARSFYASVLGAGPRDIVEMPEQARARGAPAHWLGYLEVEDVDASTAALVKRGAMALGPKRTGEHGFEAAVVREPGGAIVAVAKSLSREQAARRARGTEAVWYQLNTVDVERAMEDYRSLFGWSFGEPMDRGEMGVFHPFSWRRGEPPVGWMTDVFGRRGRHPHWLFHFAVPAMEPALAAVRGAGGYVVGPFEVKPGDRVAVCDDSQSAAFAIRAP